MRLTSLLLGGLFSSLAFAIQAQSHDHDHHHATTDHDHVHSQHSSASLDAHEHGVATLNLVLDGAHLVLELESPAANIVGFEHMPTSEKDLARVKQARQRLQQATSLFVFSDAPGCILEKAETESPLFAAAETDGHDHHEEHHAHAGHDNHADSESAHSDINVRFHFTCDNPEALQEIDVKLFEVFPNTERLRLQAITPEGQQGGELTPAQSVIRL